MSVLQTCQKQHVGCIYQTLEVLKIDKKHYMTICTPVCFPALDSVRANFQDINIGNDLNKSTYIGEVLGPGGLM